VEAGGEEDAQCADGGGAAGASEAEEVARAVPLMNYRSTEQQIPTE
jgi:hypothetical protein